MDPLIVPGSGARHLAAEMSDSLGGVSVGSWLDRFPDGELDVAIKPVIGGHDVYVVQSLSPPVNDRLVELLLLLDACRRESAARVTAVVPYLAYARKDRSGSRGEAVSLKVVARLLDPRHLDHLVVVDPHIEQMESVFDVPVTVIGAAPRLAAAIRPRPSGEAVIVAPDAGAVGIAEAFCTELGTEALAVVVKDRKSGVEVSATGLAAASGGESAVVVDDIVSTGGTLQAAVEAIRDDWAVESLHIVATHPVLAPGAIDRILALEPDQVIVSDSIAHENLPDSFEVVSIAPSLTRAVESLSPAAGHREV